MALRKRPSAPISLDLYAEAKLASRVFNISAPAFRLAPSSKQFETRNGLTVATLAENVAAPKIAAQPQADLDVALLTGGFDRPYAFGMAMALVAKGVRLDVIGSDEVDSPEMHSTPNLTFFSLWPPHRAKRGQAGKLSRVAKYYARHIRYVATARPNIFHILWNSKIQFIDRTLLMLYYKALGKKVTLTAHNVNQGRRDGNDSWLNRATLKSQYSLTDHIFVHTQ